MSNNKVLKKVSAGSRIAETDSGGLKNYFQKTYIWEQLLDNEIDIIYGCKGSGKSAIYNYLTTYAYDLTGKNTLLVPAVNPRGTAAFHDLKATPPTNETEFNYIWKLYFILIIIQKLAEYNYKDTFYNEVVEKLQDSDLLPRTLTFPGMLKMAREYIKKVNPSIEPNASINEIGLITAIGVKISLTQPSTKDLDKGVVSVDYIFDLLNKSIKKNKNNLWISMDRLDVVFHDNQELEVNALRALFKVYIDFEAYDNIRLIIFLRDDIWNRITEKGLRELSHITKMDSIEWDDDSLLFLITSRLVENKNLLTYCNTTKEKAENNRTTRLEFFLKIFKSDDNPDSWDSFKWCISKIKDGKGNCSPRELIHLINSSVKAQSKLFASGSEMAPDCLISPLAMESAYKEVSKIKFSTIISEYPDLSTYLHKLKRKKVRMELKDLKIIWGINLKNTRIIANQMFLLGIFNNESEDTDSPKIKIPLLYRPALKMG